MQEEPAPPLIFRALLLFVRRRRPTRKLAACMHECSMSQAKLTGALVPVHATRAKGPLARSTAPPTLALKDWVCRRSTCTATAVAEHARFSALVCLLRRHEQAAQPLCGRQTKDCRSREDTDAGRSARGREAVENAAHVTRRVGSTRKPAQSLMRGGPTNEEQDGSSSILNLFWNDGNL